MPVAKAFARPRVLEDAQQPPRGLYRVLRKNKGFLLKKLKTFLDFLRTSETWLSAGPTLKMRSAMASLIVITGRHLRAARGLLGWTQHELSEKAKVALGTVRRMENFNDNVGARTDTLLRVTACLQKAGVEFLNDGQPGVRLKRTDPAQQKRAVREREPQG